MHWTVVGALLGLGTLGLSSAYVVGGYVPILLIAAIIVVFMRSIQTRWAVREELPSAAQARHEAP